MNHCYWTEHTAKRDIILHLYIEEQQLPLFFQAALQPDLLASYEKESGCGGKGAIFWKLPNFLLQGSCQFRILKNCASISIFCNMIQISANQQLWSSRTRHPRRIRFHVGEPSQVESSQIKFRWDGFWLTFAFGGAKEPGMMYLPTKWGAKAQRVLILTNLSWAYMFLWLSCFGIFFSRRDSLQSFRVEPARLNRRLAEWFCESILCKILLADGLS